MLESAKRLSFVPRIGNKVGDITEFFGIVFPRSIKPVLVMVALRQPLLRESL